MSKRSKRTPDASSGRSSPAQRVGDSRVGEVYEVEVERIVPGGLGLAHVARHTVFVALAAPGDRLEVEVESVRGRVLFARVRRVVEPSAVRVEPPCPYFGDPTRCGGCDFQQLDYNAQLEAKRLMILDALRRTGGITDPPPLAVAPAPRPWGYRSRAEWQLDARGRRLGYYQRGTHQVCDVACCPVAAPELERVLEDLRSAMIEGRLPNDIKEFRAVAGDDGEVALSPPYNLHEARELQRSVRGETYRFNAECFFQINHDLLPDLVAEALRPVEDAVAKSHMSRDAPSVASVSFAPRAFALDLYCGVGLFTVPLARLFHSVIGVEAHPVSARYAKQNLAAPEFAGATVETMSVKEWLARRANDLPSIEFVLLDPPRAGAEAETIASLVRLQPARIAYVSCDPVTLARDLKLLIAGGYKLESLCAFDLFPQTHHVETVAHLVRAAYS